MKNRIQSMIDSLDKTTVDGFAEALCMALLSQTNKNGLLIALRLSDDPNENIRLAKEVAKMMLGGVK